MVNQIVWSWFSAYAKIFRDAGFKYSEIFKERANGQS